MTIDSIRKRTHKRDTAPHTGLSVRMHVRLLVHTGIYPFTRAYVHAYHVGTASPCIRANMARTAIHVRERRSIMASNVTVKLENGKLVITADLDKVAKRTSKDTGDVLAAIDFEKLSALVGAQGVTGEIKVSLGVYLMDKSRAQATGTQATAPAGKRVEDMSREELLALLATKQPAPAPAPVPTKQAASKPAKAPTPAQQAARDKFAAAARAGTLKPATK